jgi:hypothetical protein|tara:strand:- start:271 stop:462 length:192 start_codon:yes stop_codon:yes gene_type:complete
MSEILKEINWEHWVGQPLNVINKKFNKKEQKEQFLEEQIRDFIPCDVEPKDRDFIPCDVEPKE